ncbi:MAG: rhomboid family intramembrane serine protease [Pseudonocardiaceae bacterium]|nr:rhomboid family intramembrane serine protease [Pseudonocardiaceae bacterium]
MPPNQPPHEQPGGYGYQPAPEVCVRHRDRPTGLRCNRCNRPACRDCLREASVGYHCVDCVAEGGRTQRYATTVAGAEPSGRELVIPLLIAVNVAVFVVTVVQAGSLGRNDTAELFQRWALLPVAVADGDVWRLVTSGFLHFGPIHLALNMLVLWVIGRDLEAVLGRSRFLTVYLVALLGGSAAVFALERVDSLTAGASGAIYGLMGALLMVLLRLRRSPGPALFIIGINVVITFTVPGISLYGHLGGLVFGTVTAAAMVYAPRDRRAPVQIGAAAALVAIAVAVVVLRYAQFAA